MCVSECVSVCVSKCAFFYVSVCECLSMWVSLFVMLSHVDKARICLAEEWVWVWVWVWVCICVCVSVLVCVCVCLCEWVSVFVVMSHVDKAWICSAEEFLELYGKVESVVRNCLLSWSGHLVQVADTRLFYKWFCFKHVSLFCAPIGAFFRCELNRLECLGGGEIVNLFFCDIGYYEV